MAVVIFIIVIIIVITLERSKVQRGNKLGDYWAWPGGGTPALPRGTGSPRRHLRRRAFIQRMQGGRGSPGGNSHCCHQGGGAWEDSGRGLSGV